MGDVVTALGKRFLGRPYEGGTLGIQPHEQLVLNLHSFDCVTFVENVLALAECVKSNRLSHDAYAEFVGTIRYRAGKRGDYSTRLHYFSDWIEDNERKGFVRDITKDLGGIPRRRVINYLSDHQRDTLTAMADSLLEKMEKIEQEIGGRTIYVLPSAQLSRVESKIQDGDLIALTTDIKGLDIRHTGFAIRMDDNRIHLLHASETDKKVEITNETLVQYLSHHPFDSGLMICTAVVRVDK